MPSQRRKPPAEAAPPPSDDDDAASVGSDSALSGTVNDDNSSSKSQPRKVIVKDRDAYPVAGISKPGPNDVLCGRGGGTNNHTGNIRFRKLVNKHKMSYLAATKVEKPKVAREVVKIWRAMDPPGRFLARTSGDGDKGEEKKSPGGGKDGKDSGVVWHDVGDKKAREKASQCLRERTPEVMPFVKKLQAQHQVALAPKAEEEAARAQAAAAEARARAARGHMSPHLGGPGAMADPAMSARFAAAHNRQRGPPQQSLSAEARAAYAQIHRQQMHQQAASASPHPHQHPRGGSNISSQFLVAPGSGASSSMSQKHAHMMQHQGGGRGNNWGAFSNQDPDFANSEGFTQFDNNAFANNYAFQRQNGGGGGQFQNQPGVNHPRAQALWEQQQASMMQQQQQQQQAAAHMHGGMGHMQQQGGIGMGMGAMAGQRQPQQHPPPQDEDENDELTLEEYQRSLEEYISRECGLTPEDAARAVDPEEARREAMEESRGSSWIKSFHSIDTQSMSADGMASITSQSIRNMAMAELAGAAGGGGGRAGAGAGAGLGAGGATPASILREPNPSTYIEDEDDAYDENILDELEELDEDGIILEEQSGRASRRTNRTSGTGEFSSSTVKTSHLDPPSPMPGGRGGGSGQSRSARSLRSRGSNKKKSRRADMGSSCASGISMFTDGTGRSKGGGGRHIDDDDDDIDNRSGKMSAARTLKSDISMMSELTDLSGTVSNMSIGR